MSKNNGKWCLRYIMPNNQRGTEREDPEVEVVVELAAVGCDAAISEALQKFGELLDSKSDILKNICYPRDPRVTFELEMKVTRTVTASVD